VGAALLKLVFASFLVSSLAMAACGLFPPATPTSPAPLGDTFFFGQAFIDANGNGQIDAADTPLSGVMFIARDARGAEFGGVTSAEGRAVVSFPGHSVYPVTLRLQPPAGSAFVLIGPPEVVVEEASDNRASFLFAPKPQ
jgi:hypothetical protein